MQNHENELLTKSGLSAEELRGLLAILLLKVRIVPSETLIPFREEAIKIVWDIDPDDVLFIACALAYPNSVIWSDDRKLKNQIKIKVLNTNEIIKFL